MNPASYILQDFCSAFNLTQIIRKATRVTENSATLIDVILASNTNMVLNANVMPCSISDHDLVYVQLRLKKDRLKPVYITLEALKTSIKMLSKMILLKHLGLLLMFLMMWMTSWMHSI